MLQKFYMFNLYSTRYWSINVDIVKKKKIKIKKFAFIREMKSCGNDFYKMRYRQEVQYTWIIRDEKMKILWKYRFYVGKSSFKTPVGAIKIEIQRQYATFESDWIILSKTNLDVYFVLGMNSTW